MLFPSRLLFWLMAVTQAQGCCFSSRLLPKLKAVVLAQGCCFSSRLLSELRAVWANTAGGWFPALYANNVVGSSNSSFDLPLINTVFLIVFVA